MAKPNLIAELAEVVRQLDRWWYAPKLAHDFIRTHHAEIEAMARDAARYRWLRDRALQFERDEGEAGTPYCVYGLGMGDCEPTWGTELDAMTDVCMKLDEQQVAAMRDSARDGGK